MSHKAALRSLLTDRAVMEEIRSDRTTLEAAERVGGSESLDVLIAGDGDAIREGAYTQTEAIILLSGRPALIVQDGVWATPTSSEIRNRLARAEPALKAAIPKVGRVEILDYATDYVGTGWMIEEDLLITNRHVAEKFGEKRGNAFSFRTGPEGRSYRARVDFLREHQRTAISRTGILEIFYMEEASQLRPDMAFVRLDKAAGTLPTPIELDSRAAKFQDHIAVIGYPAEDVRNDAFAMRDIFEDIFEVKRLSPGWLMGVRPDGKLLEHDCTTLGGNSGSLLVNLETGKACGLHFSGDYRKRNYAVSSAWLKARLAEIAPDRITVPAVPSGIGGNEALPEGSLQSPTGRKGYDASFLGSDGFQVSLPEIDDSLKEKIAPVKEREDGELKYTHFSIVMRADRRLPFFTACNIDGDLLFNFPRRKDRWFLDGRLAPEHQIGEPLYTNNSLDRGHLVRRLDPTWGQSRAEAKKAEEDTFFFTNCSPQHSQLNQRTWLSLEDYILSNAATHDLKVTVFTGPVMDDEKDRPYRNVQLPQEFWKVVVIVNSFTNQLSATGYVLSQLNYLGDLEFLYGEFKTYQVPISQIEGKTKLV